MEAISSPRIKPAAVAGMFYPAEARQLQADLDRYLAAAPVLDCQPRALILPHAGYVYSAPVAASGYRQLQNLTAKIRRVILLGPAHRVGFRGIAAHSAEAFRTPLGDVPLDRPLIDQLLQLPFVHGLDAAFAQEHCLEVQLPFLQRLLPPFQLTPLLVGQADYLQVTELLEPLADDPECLILISSDLSHYHSYAEAQRLDQQASEAILQLQPEALAQDQACGRIPVAGLLVLARRRGWRPLLLDLRNSGDTAGPRDQVVGYGAYAFV
ncbi:MAG: AmmeMemoRadiSam system protein B [Gammaproteobacteria bacterium]|nr:AmmeMemoRadiSam system protein B [Gammaproteobacteria bacterium]